MVFKRMQFKQQLKWYLKECHLNKEMVFKTKKMVLL